MSFLITWLIISFITFASRYSGAVLNLKFYIGIALTGLWWTLGVSVILLLILFVLSVLIEITK